MSVCVCCNKNELSRLQFSKPEQELQVIFYYILPTEMVRTIAEYLYQPHNIEINYKKRRRIYELEDGDDDEFIFEEKKLYNCSTCFIYNFLKFKQSNPNSMPRLRNDINWFNNEISRNKIVSLFAEYYDDVYKFVLPQKYLMTFYRSLGLIVIKNKIEEQIETNDIYSNKSIKKILIGEK
jgi:hypothetical protein